MNLQRIIAAGSLLIHSEDSTQTSDLRSLLLARLSHYRARLDLPAEDYGNKSLEEVQVLTANEALTIVEHAQRILDEDDRNKAVEASLVSGGNIRDDGPGDAPSIGTRDITHIRTLISIAIRWGTEPLLAHVQSMWPSASSRPSRSKIVDFGMPGYVDALKLMSLRFFALLFPRGVQESVPQTLISTTLLNRHTTDLLRPALVLGWVPKSPSQSILAVDDLRVLAMRLISTLPPSQTIGSLGSILSGHPLPAPHVQRACKLLMSRQLMRPDGVRGLCAVMFGEDDTANESTSLEKLEHFSRVLCSVPSSMSEEEYFHVIIPRLLSLLRDGVPPAYRRASAFSVSRILTSSTVAKASLLPLLHDAFLRPTAPVYEGVNHSPNDVLSTLRILITNTDPSPALISFVLSPVIPSLYAILAGLDHLKVSDPSNKESIRGMLLTWGHVVGVEEAVAVLWACVTDQGGTWGADVSGAIKHVESAEQKPAFALFTPEGLKRAEQDGDLDAAASFLSLRPDPVHFVRFMKSLSRVDIASELFIRLLEAYHANKLTEESDPVRTLLYLQLIVQMQTQMAGDSPSTNILKKPEHILSFIKHVLEPVAAGSFGSGQVRKTVKSGLGLEDLRIVGNDLDDDQLLDGDSDDEHDPLESHSTPTDDEMVVTTVNLLLAILEANPELPVHATPLLSDILEQTERLAKHGSGNIRTLGRESRMVLTARLASSSTVTLDQRARHLPNETAETYQKALKLLQDPVLPVRAHGLFLLRQLVTPTYGISPSAPELVPLMPAILDIFLKSIQDDDSYIFLNAVQGLSALVDGFGKDVLKSLLTLYTNGVDDIAGTVISRPEMDTRLRIGEALGQVIRRCGRVLPEYASLLVPPLFAIVRTSHLPTTLRTSALSLLGQCADTSDLALLPYIADLTDAMVHLLQIETVRIGNDIAEDSIGPDDVPTMNNAPTATNPKFPPFRRASLHFLALLVRAYTRRAYEDPKATVFLGEFPTERIATTLRYIAGTDADNITRVMARELIEALHDADRAQVGL
ncbi:hypothetical protein K488DRAFT_41568 [Vararia minispora EC-137]|uniref:Uncharacterized protein n=1 Tax=Vararia minispora EC-137 TaxID=1314806 RepID=A0ACB8QWA7_9AGAM|nr:hypothetical protein K488DRAFT_41568 [Vararia minispora EC-137]